MTDLLALPTFNGDGAFHVVVESPRGSRSKFKYDPELRVMTLSRPLPSGLRYPHDWGFVPSTRADDGDPLDAIVLWEGASSPGVVIACRPIGVLRVEQTHLASHARERNDRLMALPVKTPRLDAIRTIFDFGERVRLELEQFFLAAAAFEGKDPKIQGWAGAQDAMTLVRDSSTERQVAHGRT